MADSTRDQTAAGTRDQTADSAPDEIADEDRRLFAEAVARGVVPGAALEEPALEEPALEEPALEEPALEDGRARERKTTGGDNDLRCRPFAAALSGLATQGQSKLAMPRPKLATPRSKPPAPAPPRAALAAPVSSRVSEPDDEILFLAEVFGARPLRDDPRVPATRARRERLEVHDEAEVMAELADLVSGRGAFDARFSDEHLEGIGEGLDRRLLRKLRRGAFSVRAHLDLHGLTRAEARPKVERFLLESRQRGHRCVLIVHGRGLHSKDNVPVLKEAVSSWLLRGRIARSVLAFCSARRSDGGLGAIYVLLRR